ncbi:fibronectin type III domain-containing protein [Streptomyces sp. YU58]|uniref:fibronectin type III domain-containing protein n=1 Tax=Streptomyces sp. SX92 TaxID=3158972 RepID=UPI0027BAF404|nr:PA14 domain-containing protein [Streptomyces coralus]WLW53396.1 PA14 domain-containing protein [Streptomyces coralus]
MNPARRTTGAVAAAVVLTTAGTLLTALPAAAATTCTSPVYKRQFFANTSFSGTPKKTDCDNAIDQTWTGAPATGLPKDNFGVRYAVTRDFGSGGPFTLAASGLDGIRVYLDGVRKIDLWKNTSTTVSKTVNVTVPSGRHTLRVDYVNWTGSARLKFGYTPRTSATVDKVKPLTPTGMAWDYFPGMEEGVNAVLDWARNKEMDLAGYRVYRRVQGTSAWTRVGTTTNVTFTDVPPQTGQSYYYEVRAYDKAGNESSGTADQGPVPTPDYTAPAAPVLSAASVEASNDLSWTGSADAAVYRVLRKTDSATSYTVLGDTTATTYTDTSAAYGRAYDYKVSAIDAAKNTATSNVVRTARTITPPQNVTATTPSWGAVFTWTEPAGGDTADYEVYRSKTSPVALTYDNLTDCRSRKVSTDASGNKVRSCTDYDGDQGATYKYVMTRQNTAGRWSTASAELTVTRPGDEIPPPPVANLTAQPLEYGVKLDWDDSTAADVEKYWVYEDLSCCENEYLGTVTAGTSEFVVGPSVADGETRTYLVVAVDKYGNSLTYEDETDIDDWSGSISKVNVTEQDLRPATVPEDTAPCSLTTYTTYGDHGGMYIDCADSVATEAAGINVHRWDRATSTYVKVTDVPLAPTATNYTDTTIPTGTTVYYLLSVVAPDGSETFSNVDSSVSLPSGA